MEHRVALHMLREMETQLAGMPANGKTANAMQAAHEMYAIASHFVTDEKPCGYVLTDAGIEALTR